MKKKNILIIILVLIIVLGGAFATYYFISNKDNDKKEDSAGTIKIDKNAKEEEKMDEFIENLYSISAVSKTKYVEDTMDEDISTTKCYNLDELSEYLDLPKSYKGYVKVSYDLTAGTYIAVTNGSYMYEGYKDDIDEDNIVKGTLKSATCDKTSKNSNLNNLEKNVFNDEILNLGKAAGTKYVSDALEDNAEDEVCYEISELDEFINVDSNIDGYIIINKDLKKYIAVSNDKYVYKGLLTDLDSSKINEGILSDKTCLHKSFANISE